MTESWHYTKYRLRTRVVCKNLIETPESILDIGCGDQYLRSLFPESIPYMGIDCNLIHPDTVQHDLTLGLPELGTQHFHTAFFLGMFEYLKTEAVKQILNQVHEHAKWIVVTCNVRPPKEAEGKHHHYRDPESFQALFDETRWVCQKIEKVDWQAPFYLFICRSEES